MICIRYALSISEDLESQYIARKSLSLSYLHLLHHSDTSLILTEFNMALMKAATQSETLWNYDPSLAVDGDTNTCSFTPQSDVQRWWQVSSMAIRVSTT